MLHEIGAPFFLGRNAWEAEALVDEFLRTTYKFPGAFDGPGKEVWMTPRSFSFLSYEKEDEASATRDTRLTQ